MNKQLIRSALACSIALFASAAAHAESIRVYRAGEVPDPRVVARILGAKPAAFANLPKTRGLFYTPDDMRNDKAPVEPDVKDAGQTITEEDLSAYASAAVSAWHEKLARGRARGERLGTMQKVAINVPAKAGNLGSENAPPPASKRAAASEAKVSPAHEASNPPAANKADSLALAINFGNNSSQLTAESKRAIDSVAEGFKLAGFGRTLIVEGHTNASGSIAHNLRLSRLRAEAVKRYLIATHNIPEAALATKGLGSSKPLPGMHPNNANNRRVQFRVLVA